MGPVTEHVKENAKAYTGSLAALISQPFADHAANILMWLISVTGLIMPEGVQTSTRYVIVALVTGVAVHTVSNMAKAAP